MLREVIFLRGDADVDVRALVREVRIEVRGGIGGRMWFGDIPRMLPLFFCWREVFLLFLLLLLLLLLSSFFVC